MRSNSKSKKSNVKSLDRAKKKTIIITASLVAVAALSVSTYFIVDAVRGGDYFRSISENYQNSELVQRFNNLRATVPNLQNDKVTVTTPDPNSNTSTISLSKPSSGLNNFSVSCNWVSDTGNGNTAVSPTILGSSTRLNRDVMCIPQVDYANLNYIKNAYPEVLLDDFIFNLYSDSYVTNVNEANPNSITINSFLPGSTDNNVLLRAESFVKRVYDSLPFSSELALLNRISFINRDSAEKVVERNSNGVYSRQPNLNDVDNSRQITITTDTFTTATQPLAGDVNTDTDFRFDLQNALHTLIHEYGHHVTLHNEKITRETLLDKMKSLYSGAKLKEGVYGSWKEYEALYRYANNMEGGLSDKEAIESFRKLYGMHDRKSTGSITLNNGVTGTTIAAAPTRSAEHRLTYKQSGADEGTRQSTSLNEVRIDDFSSSSDGGGFFNDNNSCLTGTSINSKNCYFVQAGFDYGLNNNVKLDPKKEGAQKISTLLTDTSFNNRFNYSILNQELTPNNPNKNAYDFTLDCSNEYYYFSGSQTDYEVVARSTHATISYIKYYFSFEEQLARIFSVLTYQYSEKATGPVRTHRGCGFDVANSFVNNGGISVRLNFEGSVRLENKQLADYLNLKRFGIDVFKGSENLSKFFFGQENNENTPNQSIKLENFTQRSQNGSSEIIYPFAYTDSNSSTTPKTINNQTIDSKDIYYYLLGRVKLSQENQKYLFDIKLNVDGVGSYGVIPYNYTNNYSYKYKAGKGDTYLTSDFDRYLVDNGEFGFAISLDAKNLFVNGVKEVFNADRLSRSTAYIDINKNNQFDASDISLSLSI